MKSTDHNTFDLTKPPLDVNELKGLRREAEQELKAIETKERHFDFVWSAAAIVGLVLLTARWVVTLLPHSDLVLRDYLIVTPFAAAFAFAVINFHGVFSLLLALLSGSALATSFIGMVSPTVPSWIPIITAIVGIVSFVAIIRGSDYMGEHVVGPRKSYKTLLADLEVLDPTSTPQECIQFLEWCQQDETLKAYQHALAEMGRKPVVGEYQVAKDWMHHSERRRILDMLETRAREACEQLAQAV